MSDLAQRLRAVRESRGVSLDEAEHATKIRRRYLEAIDTGDYARLPEGPPARGFIKIYARYLNLDVDQTLADFEAEVGIPITQLNEVIPPPPERQPVVSRYTQTVKLPQVRWKGELPSPTEAELNLMAEEGGSLSLAPTGNSRAMQTLPVAVPVETERLDRASYRSSFSLKVPKASVEGTDLAASPARPSYRLTPSPTIVRNILVGAGAVAGLAVVVAVVALVILPLVRGLGRSTTTRPAAVPVTVVSYQATLTPAVLTESGASAPVATPAVPESQPTSAPPASSDGGAPVIPSLDGGGVELILDARERAWVRVMVDGNVVYEGIPAIGPNVRWRGKNTVGIETGNAGAFEVILNGVRLGQAGLRNAVVKLTWDSQGKVTEQ